MQDPFVRDALIAYAANEPPMTITSDVVLGAGRRSRQLRRVAAGSGAVAVMAAVFGILVLLPGPFRLGSSPAQPAVSPSAVSPSVVSPSVVSPSAVGPSRTPGAAEPFCTAASAPATPISGLPASVGNGKDGRQVFIPTEPPGHAAARFSCYLMREVSVRLPGISLDRDSFAPAGTQPLQAYASRTFDPTRPTVTLPEFNSSTTFTTSDGIFWALRFDISALSDSVTEQTAQCTAIPFCDVRSGPQGQPALVSVGDDSRGFHIFTATVYLDKTVVSASLSAEHSKGDNQPSADDLPLTYDQLIAIASAPELTLFP